eukprot:35841-Pyramimonas_sp.AAC.1
MTQSRALPPVGVEYMCSMGKGTQVDYTAVYETLVPYLKVNKRTRPLSRRTARSASSSRAQLICRS